MQWSLSKEDSLSVLHFSGEIDLHQSAEARIAFKQPLAEHCPLLILDLSGVTYMDSSGLATLVEYRRDAAAFNGRLVVAGLRPRLRNLFEIVRLNELIPVYETVADIPR